MKRVILILLLLLLLSGIGVVAWTAAGLPSVRMVWRYGFSYGPEPTGRTLTVEGIEFVEIGPGCFRMGSEKNAEGGDWLGQWCARLALSWGDQPKPSDEMPLHWVEFSRGFWAARTEVTNEHYDAFYPWNERSPFTPGENDPVLNVSWEKAGRYCTWLSERSGFPIRLPSEAEWECACRAGSDREFCFGDDPQHLHEFAWFNVNTDDKVHAVGTRRANAWGLHDFHGNALEWCEDSYHESYEGAPPDGTAWTEEGVEVEPGALGRVKRGGGWDSPTGFSRCTFRDGNHPVVRFGWFGFRLAFSSAAP